KQRPFDITKYNQRPIALKIAYLGWNYYGYAAQEGENVETIESHLFKALDTAKLIKDRESCRYNRCGRTDKGVSAFCQIVSLCVRSNLPANGEDTEELAYCTILNRLLPPDIRIISWSPVDKNFNARFHCTYRTYKYFFPAQRLDIPLMQKAAKKLIGVHDFRNFYPDRLNDEYLKRHPLHQQQQNHSYSNHPEEEEPYDMEKSSPFKMYIFEVCGKAFLWHQVRFFMGILFLIGRHLEEPDIIDTLLDLSQHDGGKLGRPSYDLADEFPLVLVDTGYPEGTFQWR
ncbi:hypothetical protein PIROE2DRAFT_36365, partial [Piromyces sp. E2]